jgi:hypothetical protein
MLPPPPGLLSTRKFCLKRSDSFWLTARARMSLVPPAVKATMMRTGRAG